ncbi:hypothetical protein PSG97_12865, partial [Enterococcus faecium]|uniref:hypothetical protein n=1 Tax=Enterococcus faecium TaxID=1352 RepID=UPI0029541C53
IVIPPAIFFYYSTLFDSRFKTLQQNPLKSLHSTLKRGKLIGSATLKKEENVYGQHTKAVRRSISEERV